MQGNNREPQGKWLYLSLFRLIIGLALMLFVQYLLAQQPTPAASGEPYASESGMIPPAPLFQPMPPYTEEAAQAVIEGTVLVRANIRSDGTVANCKIIRGLGYGLDEAAIRTITASWRFKPATFNGNAVDVDANIQVTFGLNRSTPAAKAKLQQYPLRFVVLDKQSSFAPNGPTVSGKGNLRENSTLRKFRFTGTCTPLTNPFRNIIYPAKWIKSESQLAILAVENVDVEKECELKVKMIQ